MLRIFIQNNDVHFPDRFDEDLHYEDVNDFTKLQTCLQFAAHAKLYSDFRHHDRYIFRESPENWLHSTAAMIGVKIKIVKISNNEQKYDVAIEALKPLSHIQVVYDCLLFLQKQSLQPQAVDALKQYPFSKLDAVKYLKGQTELGLKEAKELLDPLF